VIHCYLKVLSRAGSSGGTRHTDGPEVDEASALGAGPADPGLGQPRLGRLTYALPDVRGEIPRPLADPVRRRHAGHLDLEPDVAAVEYHRHAAQDDLTRKVTPFEELRFVHERSPGV
jgi:hypothetical protein